METLIVLVALLAIFLLIFWLQAMAEPRTGSEAAGVNGIPEFKGQILTVPDEENSYENLAALLAAYIRAAGEIEVERGLARTDGFKVEDDTGAQLQDLRYRIFLISLLMLQGSFHTAAVYGENAAGCSMYFYPEIFIVSCEAVEKDLTQLSSIYE